MLQNAVGRTRFLLRHPVYSLRSLVREAARTDERFLARMTKRRTTEIRQWLSEPFRCREFADHLRQVKRGLREVEAPGPTSTLRRC
jgi:hypothetical protein